MKYKAIAVSFTLALLSGCSTIGGQYEADPIMKQQTDLLETGKDIVDTAKLSARIANATNQSSRNVLIGELVTISDRVCSQHQASIIANANTWNVATGTATNLLSALGTVIGGETTKAALAAGAAFSSSSRSLVNEEVYVESVGTTIVRAISVAREKYYSKLKNGMSKSVADYSVTESLRDVQEYHRRCSFYYGLLEISKSLEQRKKTKHEIDSEINKLIEHRTKVTELGGTPTDIDTKINSLILERVDAPN